MSSFFDNRYLPESIGVYVSPYVLHHDPRYFSPNVDEFVPERWLSQNVDNGEKQRTYITSQDAFIPFSTGPMNCAGKALAYIEMRMVLAMLVQKFDLCKKDGWNAERWPEGIKDWFVVEKPSLPVVLRRRAL